MQKRSASLTFLKNIDALKSLIIQDANINIKNVNCGHSNVNEIFTYLKAIIRQVILKNEMLKQQLSTYQQEIQRLDPVNQLLQMKKEKEKKLGEAVDKLGNLVPFSMKKAAGFNCKFIGPMISDQPEQKERNIKSNNKEHMRRQAQQVQAFITRELAPNLTQDPMMGFALPKDMILSLYTKWNRLNGRQTHHIKPAALKSLLTNEIKRLFPTVVHSEKSYRGIAFRKDLMKDLDFSKEQRIESLKLEGLQSVDFEDFEDLKSFDHFQPESQKGN